MIYCNTARKAQTWKRSYGNVDAFRLGQSGRRRFCCLVMAPEEVHYLEMGRNEGITVSQSHIGCPRLVVTERGRREAYLLLSSKKAYEKMGSGKIYALAWKKPEIIARGLGASGSAGNVGTWPEYLIKAKPGDAYIVRWSGYGYGIPSTLYFVDRNLDIHEADISEVATMFDALGMEPPFSIVNKDGVLTVDEHEWKVI